jgi:hypothetical protein
MLYSLATKQDTQIPISSVSLRAAAGQHRQGERYCFVRDINFAGTEWKPAPLKVSDGDGWAIQGEGMTFGWVVNPLGGVANETLSVPGLADGEYDVHVYRPRRGDYLNPIVKKGTAPEEPAVLR